MIAPEQVRPSVTGLGRYVARRLGQEGPASRVTVRKGEDGTWVSSGRHWCRRIGRSG